MQEVCEVERWSKSRSTNPPCQPDARGRRTEGFNDEVAGTVGVCSYGHRHVATQFFVN